MSTDYWACFMDASLERRLSQARAAAELKALFLSILRDKTNRLLIGPHANCFSTSAVLEYLASQRYFRAFGSKLGEQLASVHHWSMAAFPTNEVPAIVRRCEQFDPEMGALKLRVALRDTALSMFCREGRLKDLEDAELEAALDSYVEIATSLFSRLKQAWEQRLGLIIFAPD